MLTACCVTGTWSFCLNMAQFRIHCLKMPFSYQVLQKNPPTSTIPITLQDWNVNLGLGPSSGMENENQGAQGCFHTSQIRCSLSPSSHPQLWAQGKLSPSSSSHPFFLDRTAAKTSIVPWTSIKSKLNLGCKHANNSLWQTPAAAADYMNQLCKSGDLICANCRWKTIGPG